MENCDEVSDLARNQIDAVKSVFSRRFNFEDNKTNEVQGGYTTYGTLITQNAIVVMRISNHICSMNNWTERYKPKLTANKKLLRRMGRNIQSPYKERHFYSIVFKSFDYTPNDNGSWNAKCYEYVFNPTNIENNGEITNIINDAQKIKDGNAVTINGIEPQIRMI